MNMNLEALVIALSEMLSLRAVYEYCMLKGLALDVALEKFMALDAAIKATQTVLGLYDFDYDLPELEGFTCFEEMNSTQFAELVRTLKASDNTACVKQPGRPQRPGHAARVEDNAVLAAQGNIFEASKGIEELLANEDICSLVFGQSYTEPSYGSDTLSTDKEYLD